MLLLNSSFRLVSAALLIGICSTNSMLHTASPDTSPVTAPANDWLILDGVRNFSYNMVCHLVNTNTPCTVLTRPHDLYLTELRLPKSRLITIIPFDYTAQHKGPEWETIGAGSKYLFMDPEDDSYSSWHKTVVSIAKNALFIAKKQKLTLFYPARVYPLGHPEGNIITEQSPYNPSTAQGLTLSSIEHLLQHAADTKECKIRKIRISYPFGKGVLDYLLSSSFKDIPVLGRLTWLFRTDRPHQFVYAGDVPRLAIMIAEQRPEPYSFTLHFSGYTFESVEAFGTAICAIAQKPLKQRIVSKFQLNLVTLAEPNASRGSDLEKYFEQPVYLEDSEALVKEFNFSPTPLETAIQETLNWFKQHPNTRSVFQKL